MTKFHDYRMLPNDSVAQYVARVENMARQLTDLGENLSDVTIMAKILGSLLTKYNAFVTAWDSVEPDKQTLENLTTHLIKDETRMTAEDDVTSALSAVNTNKQQKFFDTKYNPKRPDDKRKDVECFYCHKKDHVIKYCKKKPKNRNPHKSKPPDDGQHGIYATFMVESDTLNIMEANQADIWTLDSGASRHMTFHREWLQDFTEGNTDSVTLGDGKPCKDMVQFSSDEKLAGDGWMEKLKTSFMFPHLIVIFFQWEHVPTWVLM